MIASGDPDSPVPGTVTCETKFTSLSPSLTRKRLRPQNCSGKGKMWVRLWNSVDIDHDNEWYAPSCFALPAYLLAFF